MSQYFQSFLEKCAGVVDSIGKCTFRPELPEVSFWMVTGLALVDSINPCAIAVILILLTTLITAQKRDRVWKAGIAFILGLYLSYFLFGLGLFSTLKFVAYKELFHLVIGIFAIIVGLYNLKVGFWPPKKAKQVCIGGVCAPDSTTARVINKITSIPGAFIAGIIVSVFELPCTGGPYFVVLGLLAQSYTWIKIVPTLIYYNFIFVLPLIILTGLVYWGFSSVEKTSKWKDKHASYMEVVSGIIMVGLGIWVILV